MSKSKITIIILSIAFALSIGCNLVQLKKNTPIDDQFTPVAVLKAEPTIDNKSTDGSEVIINGNRIKAPAGSTVSVVTEKTTSGEDVGVGVKTNSDTSQLDMSGNSPGMSFDWGSISSGSMVFASKLVTGKNSGMTTLMIVGGIMVAGGIVLIIVTKRLMFGSAIAIGGVSLIGIAVISTTYPWVWMIAFLILAGLGVYIIFDARAKERLMTTAKAIVGGIETSDDSLKANLKEAGVPDDKLDAAVKRAKEAVKESIGEQAGDKSVEVKSVVTEIKNQNGFH